MQMYSKIDGTRSPDSLFAPDVAALLASPFLACSLSHSLALLFAAASRVCFPHQTLRSIVCVIPCRLCADEADKSRRKRRKGRMSVAKCVLLLPFCLHTACQSGKCLPQGVDCLSESMRGRQLKISSDLDEGESIDGKREE